MKHLITVAAVGAVLVGCGGGSTDEQADKPEAPALTAAEVSDVRATAPAVTAQCDLMRDARFASSPEEMAEAAEGIADQESRDEAVEKLARYIEILRAKPTAQVAPENETMRRNAEDLLSVDMADCEPLAEQLRTALDGIPATP